MKAEQFQKLLVEHCVKTSNIRTMKTKWPSSVERIPNKITNHIGSVISLLQVKIEEGYFCKKDQYIMIYNFQPLQISESAYLCSLDMVIRPVSEINNLNLCKGIPFQLIVNGTTGEVGNSAYGIVAMGLMSEEETEGDAPVIYGNYKDYFEPKQRDLSTEFSALIQEISLTGKKEEEIKIEKELIGLNTELTAFEKGKTSITSGTTLSFETPSALSKIVDVRNR